jgi:hypothetical protein
MGSCEGRASATPLFTVAIYQLLETCLINSVLVGHGFSRALAGA